MSLTRSASSAEARPGPGVAATSAGDLVAKDDASVRVHDRGTCQILVCDGDLDLATAEQLIGQGHTAIENAGELVVVDLTRSPC